MSIITQFVIIYIACNIAIGHLPPLGPNGGRCGMPIAVIMLSGGFIGLVIIPVIGMIFGAIKYFVDKVQQKEVVG